MCLHQHMVDLDILSITLQTDRASDTSDISYVHRGELKHDDKAYIIQYHHNQIYINIVQHTVYTSTNLIAHMGFNCNKVQHS